MMSNGLTGEGKSLVKPDTALSPRKDSEESLVQRPRRVLIMGSRLSGAGDISAELVDYVAERGHENVSVEVLRDATRIREALLDEGEGGTGNVPIGVILLDEMRQTTSLGQGMTIPVYQGEGETIYDYVSGLCEKHDIPLVAIERYEMPDQLQTGLLSLLKQQND